MSKFRPLSRRHSSSSSSSSSSSGADRKSASDRHSHLNLVDRVGVGLELRLTRFFTAWGVFCAEYPLPVIVLGFSAAVALCTGAQFLDVTTDPVKLWVGPGGLGCRW